MTPIVLTALGLLACGFYVYVLIHWILERQQKTSTRSTFEDQANEKALSGPKRPFISGSRKGTRRHDRFTARLQSPASVAMRSRSNSLGCHECERNAYEVIARSWSLHRKTSLDKS